MSKPLNFVLIGRSGSGKGTQAKFLIKHFGNFVYISSGDLFRKLIKADTAVGKRVKKVVEKGGLPFDEIATTLWMHEFSYNVKDGQNFILDGAPRRLNEAKTLDGFLEFLERKDSTFILLLDISREEAFARLSKRRICKKCGRLAPWVGEFKKMKVCDRCGGELSVRRDDTREAINRRLDYYETKVVPVIKFYEGQKKLIKINGEQSIENVFKEILNKLKIQNPNFKSMSKSKIQKESF